MVLEFFEERINDTVHECMLYVANLEPHPPAKRARRGLGGLGQEYHVGPISDSRNFGIFTYRVFMSSSGEDIIEHFGGRENDCSKPETVPLEKRVDRIMIVDDGDEECHMENGEINGMESSPLFL